MTDLSKGREAANLDAFPTNISLPSEADVNRRGQLLLTMTRESWITAEDMIWFRNPPAEKCPESVPSGMESQK